MHRFITPSKSLIMLFLLLLFNLTALVCAQGTQFITGPCTSDADCASSCCGFNSGKCAGPVVAQERDGGCGFGNAQPNDDAARALTGGQPAATSPATNTASAGANAASAPAGNANTAGTTPTRSASTTVNSNLAGSANVGNGAGKQFITGQCLSDADCASGCCGFNTGLCAGAVIAQTRDGGCGFGNAQPNDNAAKTLTGGGGGATTSAGTGTVTGSGSGSGSGNGSGSAAPSPSTTKSSSGAVDSSLAGAANVGNGAGKQFITGQCFSDADCASGCCGFNSGKCAGAIIAQTRDGGCGFGDAQPNDTAAQALTGGARRKRGRRSPTNRSVSIGVREFMA
ncbi:hypothetical protein A1O3_10102 [Capronia epimyces CBS 606.96]|uniref:Biotrophy-associated secreted protein 2 n=1 Tax=Capronia epimyces CBS 606.96 TaxID=1182542 RepID=W9XHY1_9EURO|nr:uncharacterized protein A1O3_10102 [Capronia epimyces CBS 606.96]EXJ76945.1 hypothetical protein A1O3_10102 [Capronia epimyces CBS 606.96]